MLLLTVSPALYDLPLPVGEVFHPSKDMLSKSSSIVGILTEPVLSAVCTTGATPFRSKSILAAVAVKAGLADSIAIARVIPIALSDLL